MSISLLNNHPIFHLSVKSYGPKLSELVLESLNLVPRASWLSDKLTAPKKTLVNAAEFCNLIDQSEKLIFIWIMIVKKIQNTTIPLISGLIQQIYFFNYYAQLFTCKK